MRARDRMDEADPSRRLTAEKRLRTRRTKPTSTSAAPITNKVEPSKRPSGIYYTYMFDVVGEKV